MPFPRRPLFAALVLTFTATACAHDETTSKIDPSKPYNDADVTFATDMIQHHAQELQMVDLTLGRHLDPKVAALAEDIRTAQVPEIETMVDLLDAWEQPVPETSRDHVNSHHEEEGGAKETNAPDRTTSKDLKAVEAAEGAAFQATWLSLMIKHHERAIEMATTETDDGEDKKATALAEEMVGSHRAQVSMMQESLDQ